MGSNERSALLTVSEIADLLQISISQANRLVAEGCPAIDVSIGRPNRRKKRSLRFNPVSVLVWLATRQEEGRS